MVPPADPPVRSTPVLIVGGGPVGLTLALCLQKQNVPCILCDRYLHPATGVMMPKGQQISERTMEIWRSLDPQLPDEVLARQQVPDSVFLGVHVRALRQATDGTLAPAPGDAWTGVLPPGLSAERSTRVPQGLYEELLRAKLAAPVDCLFGWEVADLRLPAGPLPKGGSARLRRVEGDGEGESDLEVQFGYVVGCDGGRSLVRKTLGIEFEGPGALAQATTVVFRSKALFPGLCQHFGQSLAYNVRVPGQPAAVLWLTGGTELFYGSVAEGDAGGGSQALDSLFDARSAAQGAEQAVLTALRAALALPFEWDAEPLSTYRWKPYSLVAESFGRGCAFIAGDAAHLMSPAGGQGMNTGVGDAFNLGWKLAAVVTGWAGPDLLATYCRERRPVVRRKVDVSKANIGAYQNGENRVMDALDAALGERYGHALPENGGAEDADRGAQATDPPPWERAAVGCRCPEICAEPGVGEPLLHRVAADALTLVVSSRLDLAAFQSLGQEAGVPLRVLSAGPGRTERLAPFTLVRPDHFVAWCGDTVPPAAVMRRAVRLE